MEETKDTTDITESTQADGGQEISGYTLEEGKRKPCKYCRVMVPKKAKICPNCKKRIKSHWLRNLLLILLVIAVCAGGVYCYFYGFPGAYQVMNMFRSGSTDIVEETKPVEVVYVPTESQVSAEEFAGVEERLASIEKSVSEIQDAQAELSLLAENTEADEEETEVEGFLQAAAGQDDTEGAAEDGREQENAVNDRNGQDGAKEQEAVDIGKYSEEEFRKMCRQVDYRKLMRTPEDYVNQCLALEAVIQNQVDGGLFDDNIYYLVSAEDAKGVERYYILRDDRGEDAAPLFEGDMITIYGQMFDTCKVPVEYVARDMSVPAVTVVYLDLKEE